MYKQLYKEHLNLQRSFSALYRLFVIKDGGGLEKHVLRWLQEKERLERIAGYFQSKVNMLERELQESQERSELLEFCLLENLAKVPSAEDVVDEGVNTDPCCLFGDHRASEFSGIAHHSCAMASSGGQGLGGLSQHLQSEDPGGGDRIPMDHIMSAVRELQSLVEWTSQRKGAKEDSSVVKQKLQQLDKIRKELEKSASDSRCFLTQSGAPVTDLHSFAQSDTGGCGPQTDADLLDNLWTETGKDHDAKTIQSERVLPQSQISLSEQSPPRDRSVTFRAIAEEFNPNRPLLDEQETCDSPLAEKDLNMYIDFVSTKEQIQQLTMNLETEQSVKGTKKGGRHSDEIEEPDSLGTVISEDEGLGEESRRADSMGSNSFLDMHASEDDLVDAEANKSSVREAEKSVSSEKSDSVWINNPQDPRVSLELCRCTIYKLKESLRSREDQLRKLAAYRDSANEVSSLQDLVSKLEREIEELKLKLKDSDAKNSALQEQVLELEEAENDSRRQCQRLEENLVFLQEKDSHFQVELTETKHALELCVERLAIKEMGQKELYSQMKYMEVLIQKYEDQIRDHEDTENAMKEELAECELLKSLKKQQEDSLCHKGTQTYPVKNDDNEEKQNAVEDRKFGHSKSSRHSEFQDKGPTSVTSCGDTSVDSCSKTKGAPSSSVAIGIQVDLILKSVDMPKDHSTQTEQEERTETKSIHKDEHSPVQPENESGVVSISSEETFSSSCPFQKELFHRLHHLVKEDANLQQQLHHMDEINLTLWKKLHNLESHIGECKRENLDRLPLSDDEISFSYSVVPPVPKEFADDVIPPPLSSSISKSLDAGAEEHFISNGKSVHFDCSEMELRERLSQLDEINSSFEAELAQREKLHSKRELKHKEWVESENRFISDLRNLEKAKNSLLATVAHLKAEQHQLESKLKKAEDELIGVQDRNRRQISQMSAEHEALTSELQERISALALREKEYLGQITNLRLEKKTLLRKDSATGELEKLKFSYVQLQIELNQNRNNMMQMENDFGEQMEALKRKHLCEERKLGDEIRQLKERQNDFHEQTDKYQKKQVELEETLATKEQELECARGQFREHMLMMEEEHKSVENKLNKKLRQMEESTAFATRALTEEKTRLEKDLQENICDLKSKEELYKDRITELEANVTELHDELRRLTGDLDSGLAQYQGSEFPPFQKERLQKQLQELQSREEELREKLEEMEQKEAAYRETLENADRIVASVERGYKNKIEELEMSERSLKQRVNQLEEVENRLRIALHRERRSSDGRKPDDLVVELLEAEARENALKEQVEFLEQSQRTASQKLKELEKMREKLEAQLCDQEELMASLKRLQQEQEATRKDIANLRKSENELREGLQQAESLIRSKDTDMQTEMKRMQNEKRDLEETIHQLRMQVRQLQSVMDSDHEESGETLGETVAQSPEPVGNIPGKQQSEDARSQEVMDGSEGVELYPTPSSPNEKENGVNQNLAPLAEGEVMTEENSEGSTTVQQRDMEAPGKNGAYRFIDDPPSVTDSGDVQYSAAIEDERAQYSVTPEDEVAQYSESLEEDVSSQQDVEHLVDDQMQGSKDAEEISSDFEEEIGVFREVQLKKQDFPSLEEGDKGLHKSVSILQIIHNLKKEKEDVHEMEAKVRELSGIANEVQQLSEDMEVIPHMKAIAESQLEAVTDFTTEAPEMKIPGISNKAEPSDKSPVITTQEMQPVSDKDLGEICEGTKPDPGKGMNETGVEIKPDPHKELEKIGLHMKSVSGKDLDKTTVEIKPAPDEEFDDRTRVEIKSKLDKELDDKTGVEIKPVSNKDLDKTKVEMEPASGKVTDKMEVEMKPVSDKELNKTVVGFYPLSDKDLPKAGVGAKSVFDKDLPKTSVGIKHVPDKDPCADECSKARMQLEECMIRAMVAMEFDMRQKKASQRMNAGRDASSPTPGASGALQSQKKGSSAEVKESVENRPQKRTIESPFNFRVVQQVGSDTLLVGWEHAHPADIEGFEVYVDGVLHETVYTSDRTKAVISGIDLRQPLTLSVCAVSRFGGVSDPQVLRLPLHSPFSNDGFFFLDDEDDDDDVLFGEEEPEKQTRPYSMEW